MRIKKIIAVAAIISMAVLTGCGGNSGNGKNKLLQIKGSDTILNLGQALSEKAMTTNKGLKLSVTGGGSGTGIAALINRSVDIAQSSRPIKDKEIESAAKAGVIVKEIIVGYDGITVIGNKNNTIKNLTTEQLKSIYLGEINNWKEVGGADKTIVVLSRDSSSGTHIFFKEHIIRGGNEKGPEEYRKDTLFLPSNQAIVTEVEKNDGAIGYIGMGYMTDTVDGITVDGIAATVENIENKSYSISRGLFWYINGEPAGDIKTFIDFTLSPIGQEIVKKEGFVPVK
jgi:phosphate transport system substrate-binding protein